MNVRPHEDSGAAAPAFEELFCRLFEQQYASLFRYLQRLTGDADIADDLAQEVFVRLHQRGSLPDDVRGWMGAVAHNLLRDQQRTGKRRMRILQARPLDMNRRVAESADEKVLGDERRKAVHSALEKLSMRERQMLLLRHEGYSYREIAHAVAVKEASVGTMLLRATEAFHKAYKERQS